MLNRKDHFLSVTSCFHSVCIFAGSWPLGGRWELLTVDVLLEFAYALASGNLHFHQKRMSEHLLRSLDRGRLDTFPFPKKQWNWPKLIKQHVFDVFLHMPNATPHLDGYHNPMCKVLGVVSSQLCCCPQECSEERSKVAVLCLYLVSAIKIIFYYCCCI